MNDNVKLIINEDSRYQKTYTVMINDDTEEVFSEYGAAITYVEDQGFDQSQIRVIDETVRD